MADYVSIRDWINYPDPMSNEFYPFGDAYNLPYDISLKLWDIIGGTLAWLLDLLFPGNTVSEWLVCDGTSNFFALVIFMIVWLISSVGLTITILMHSGKGTGLSDIMASSIYSGTSGSSIVEKNLDRLTLIFVIMFIVSIMVLMLIYPKGTIGI